MHALSTLSYSSDEILTRRNKIGLNIQLYSPNIRDTNINRISTTDLKLLFDLYDELFFQKQFAQNFKGRINFSLSNRLIKTAGKTLSPKNIDQIPLQDLVVEIRISTYLLFKYGEVQSNKNVAGIATTTALEALQLIFEHELCHVLELIVFKKSSCKRERFKVIARNLFGHTESTHHLPTPRRIAQEKYGLQIGDEVSFNYNRRQLQGTLYKINKRATVMVKDGNGGFIDHQGNHYTKYYVPIKMLNRE